MPIDPNKALGAPIPEVEASWTPDDIILYHLGLGAGSPPTDPRELAYTYEGKLQALPSYGVVPVFPALADFIQVPGIEINPMMVLHGEQDLEVRKPIPTHGRVTSEGRVAGIYDKGKGAVIILEMETRDSKRDVLFVNRFTIFVRGEGGFGGDPGPKPANVAPDRAPDAEIESPTLPQQALIYRLSGDKNPLHADPDMAKLAGYDRPILHGLCTYGIVCKAVVDHVLDGDASRVAGYQARFSGPVFPGETVITSVWREGDDLVLQARTKERGEPVLTNTAITLG